MTAPRRRFFAARPAQQIPGRTLELAVQVRRDATAALTTSSAAPAPEPGPGPTQARATWLLPQLFDFNSLLEESHDIWATPLEDGRWAFTADYGSLRSIWEGEPAQVDPDTDEPMPIPGPGFDCTEVKVASNYNLRWPGRVFFGVLRGMDMSQVRWQLEWSDPWQESWPGGIAKGIDFDTNPADGAYIVSRYGHRAYTWDNLVMVRVWFTDGGAGGSDTLTAIAYSGATEVGRLVFHAYSVAY